MEQKVQETSRRIGLVISDPLRQLGLEVILRDHSRLTAMPLSIPGVLHSFELSIVMIDTRSAPDLSDLLATFRRQRPDLRVIVLGPAADLDVIQQIIGAGAKGYLTLDARETEVSQCVEVVRDGSIWAPRKVLARLIDAAPQAALPAGSRFTDREDQVLRLLIEGKPNRDIALDLGIDEGTVKAHISRLMRKVGVGNRTALTMAVLNVRSH